MTTTNTRYVDPNAEVGGDGTTDALTGEHCAYKSLAIWEAARQGDLVSGDIIERVICSSDDAGSTHLADTTSCTMYGWTIDATHYPSIEAASSHGGKWNDSIYRMIVTDNHCVRPLYSYIRFVGIQFQVSGATTTRYAISPEGASIYCDRCIFAAGNANDSAIYRLGADGYVRNTLFYDFSDSHTCYSSGTMGTFANCTFQNCNNSSALIGWSSFTAINCGAAGCSKAISGTTCSNDTPTFVDADNDDFHLAAGDTTWRGGGTDLSASFTDDIDGDTRSAWDIGCDEYVAAASTRGMWPFPWPTLTPLTGVLPWPSLLSPPDQTP